MLTFRPARLHDAFPISLNARHIDRIEWRGLGPDSITLTGMLVSAIEKATLVWAGCWEPR